MQWHDVIESVAGSFDSDKVIELTLNALCMEWVQYNDLGSDKSVAYVDDERIKRWRQKTGITEEKMPIHTHGKGWVVGFPASMVGDNMVHSRPCAVCSRTMHFRCVNTDTHVDCYVMQMLSVSPPSIT